MVLGPGVHLGAYEIVALIGAGGMGEVYKAKDTRLDRHVAIKVLPHALVPDPDRVRRFEHEARAIAALSHPNVLAIYDIGFADAAFIVMELLDGETLRVRLERGPLPWTAIADLALQLLAGLAAAHAAGIVHRDLKPENVLVTTDGLLKILDFGLAKSASAAVAETATATPTATVGGLLLGTIGYMSPEQVRGEPADHRSDLFAVGVLLYEMAAGLRPFRGNTAADILSAVLAGTAPELPSTCDVPRGARRIIERCIEKRPADRFQSSSDLRFAIEALTDTRRPAARMPAPVQRAIAILPFTDMSPQADHAYFCEGMAEEIINALARVDGLRVAPRTSTFHCRQKTSDLADLARLLDVDTILEGSVRTSGDRLRVAVQLVDVRDGHAIWSDRFDGTMNDVFAIQDDIAGKIVSGLRGRLVGEALAAIPRHTASIDAYHLYLRGRHERFTTFRLFKAKDAFERAVALDPEYAPALVGLADVATTLAVYGMLRPADVKRAVGDAIDAALARDEHLAFAHAARARYAWYFDASWIDALCSFDRALALDADAADIHGMLALCYMNISDDPAARRHASRGVALDPLSAWNHGVSAFAAYVAHRFDDAESDARAALDLRPDSVFARWILGMALTRVGRGADAVAALQPLATAADAADYLLAHYAAALSAAGQAESAAAIDETLRRRSAERWVSPAWLALSALSTGRSRDAIESIQRGAADPNGWALWLMMPMFDALRGDPEFERVARKLGPA